MCVGRVICLQYRSQPNVVYFHILVKMPYKMAWFNERLVGHLYMDHTTSDSWGTSVWDLQLCLEVTLLTTVLLWGPNTDFWLNFTLLPSTGSCLPNLNGDFRQLYWCINQHLSSQAQTSTWCKWKEEPTLLPLWLPNPYKNHTGKNIHCLAIMAKGPIMPL